MSRLLAYGNINDPKEDTASSQSYSFFTKRRYKQSVVSTQRERSREYECGGECRMESTGIRQVREFSGRRGSGPGVKSPVGAEVGWELR